VSTPEDKAADAVEEETTATEVGDYDAEAVDADDTEAVAPAEPEPGSRWARVLAFGVLPVLALLLGGAAGYLRYDYSSRHDADTAGTESVQAARDSTIALLSYKPESVDKDLTAARDRLTGSFLDAYTQLVNTVVIPGAKEKKISAVAQVPAAASVSAKPDHAVVLARPSSSATTRRPAPPPVCGSRWRRSAAVG
jgi:Mce-associated membrane protein